jgi:hypothetical protein
MTAVRMDIVAGVFFFALALIFHGLDYSKWAVFVYLVTAVFYFGWAIWDWRRCVR